MRRFGIDYELNSIDDALADYQGEAGASLQWYRWNPDSAVDDIYDVGAPRQWELPVEVPALFVLGAEGGHVFADRGLQTVTTIAFAISQSVFRDRLGWEDEFKHGQLHQYFLRDRVGYRGQLFTIDSLAAVGDVGGRDVVVSGGGREVREDTRFIDIPP